MQHFFTVCFLSAFFCLFTISNSSGQTSFNNLKTSLLKAHKDSIPAILEKIKEKLTKEQYEAAKTAWLDLFKDAQKTNNMNLITLVYGEVLNFFGTSGKNAEKIAVTYNLINYGKLNNQAKASFRGYESLYQIYAQLNQPDKALDNILKALDVCKQSKDSTGMFSIYATLANFYYGSKDIKQTRKYALDAYKIKKHADNTRSSINNTNTIALSYWADKDATNALKYYELALEEANKNQDKAWIGIVSGNMSLIYLARKEYDKALFYLLKDLRASEDEPNTTNAYLGIGEVYMAKKQFPTAKAYLDSAMTLAQKNKNISLLYAVSGYFKRFYEQQRDFEQAYKYSEDMFVLRDSLFKLRQDAQIKKVQSQYDFDKQAEQITFLEEKNDLQNQNIQQQKYINYGIILFALILGLFVYLQYRSNQKTQKLNQTLHLQKEEILTQNEELQQNQEEILAQRDFIEKQNQNLRAQNTQIHSSMKAALTIQKAILPFESRIQQLLKKSFIIYLPKDIVSGDFYWIEKVGNKTIVAVADCTGHGVPGAFMSLIASNLLEKIVFQQNITQPAQILNNLHTLIHIALNIQKNDNSYGLDIGIITIEEENKSSKITFAGAKRPLYYFSAENPSKLEEVVGTRKSIGRTPKVDIAYEDNTITLPTGSIIYMSTDGYIDQNDVKRKKLGKDQFFKTLQDIQAKDFEAQKELLSELLKKHMQGTEQRDDILLLGLSV
jgi:serine phosphatase RsbU (regulator of sigma subunit)